MLKINLSYKSISEDLQNPEMEDPCLNKQVVLNRMIEDLPSTP